MRVASSVLVIFTLSVTLFLAGCGNNAEEVFRAAELAFSEQDFEKAIRLFDEAEQHFPDHPPLFTKRAASYAFLEKHAEAEKAYGVAIRKTDASNINNKTYHLAFLYFARGRERDLLGQYRESLQDYERSYALESRHPRAMNNLAWLLATCPQEDVRDPKRAVTIATEACHAEKWEKEATIDTLAAAYAAATNFEMAVKMQQKALDMLSDEDRRKGYEERLELFKNKKAYHETEASRLQARE